MLTDLDAVLFPDDCEVVEIPLHNRYIYLIQKNGSSSIRKDARAKGWHTLCSSDLRELDAIDVYLRDPVERYISGVNTFVQHLMRDIPGLHQETCDLLVTRYHFLNRHCLPQWHWLVNLARFINRDCQIRLHALEDLALVTDHRSHAGIKPLSPARARTMLSEDQKLEFWFLLDRILLGRCGQSLTWPEILQIYQEHPANPMLVLQDRMEAVRHVLC